MNDLDVRIVTLEPMRVASVHGFGPSPELVAWEKLMAWAGPKGLLDEPASFRIFGFNNPSPSPGSPNYGYDFWITVGPEVAADAEAQIVDFPGGLYAVTRCRGVEAIGPTWQKLVRWLANSRYRHASHQWLEEHLDAVDVPGETCGFDLYAPIAE
jgi:DNA gyrase inhibitor GyrI